MWCGYAMGFLFGLVMANPTVIFFIFQAVGFTALNIVIYALNKYENKKRIR